MDTMRNTVQRQAVLDAVRQLNRHATAEQVYEHVVQKHPHISKATVYRNLSQMAEAGELVNIGAFDGSTHYDHNRHAHYHFVCEDCKQVFDVEGYLPDLAGQFSGMEHFTVTGHLLTFRGLCLACKARPFR